MAVSTIQYTAIIFTITIWTFLTLEATPSAAPTNPRSEAQHLQISNSNYTLHPNKTQQTQIPTIILISKL
jgi:hypothetical protein